MKCGVGCPYFQKMSPIILQKRYVIPIYKKMHFPEFQSFPTSSSFGKSVLKNTKEIFENTKENRWSEKIQISYFRLILFGLLNFMAGFLESQRFFWYPHSIFPYEFMRNVFRLCVKIWLKCPKLPIITHDGTTYNSK